MKDGKKSKKKDKKNKKKLKETKQKKLKFDREDIIEIKKGVWINAQEHPKYYNGRDITKNGKFTLQKADDMKLYTEWIEAERAHPTLEELKYTSKCGNYSFTVTLFRHHMKRYIEQLPEEEVEEVEKMWRNLQDAFNASQSAKKKAFPNVKAYIAASLSTKERRERKKQNAERILKYQKVIIELFGRRYPLKEIHRICVKNLKIIISKDLLLKIEQENLELISNLHARYKDGDVTDLRLSSKRGRLEEIEDLFYQIKASFEETGSKADARLLKELIESARKEEGEKVSVKVQGELNMTIKHEISDVSQEIFKHLNLNQIIISRVASRMGVNPLQIITDMQTSAYARFNGMINLQDSSTQEEYENMVYPTAMPYDFGNIEKAQEALTTERKERIEKIEESKQKYEAVGKEKGAKSLLLEKLKKIRLETKEVSTELNRADYLLEKKELEKKVDGRTKKGKELKRKEEEE